MEKLSKLNFLIEFKIQLNKFIINYSVTHLISGTFYLLIGLIWSIKISFQHIYLDSNRTYLPYFLNFKFSRLKRIPFEIYFRFSISTIVIILEFINIYESKLQIISKLTQFFITLHNTRKINFYIFKEVFKILQCIFIKKWELRNKLV